LPQDQNRPYLTIFGDPRDARFQEIVTWFETQHTLIEFKRQTHYNVITTDSVLYRDRYADTVDQLPLIRLQTANVDDEAIEFKGNSIPMSADALGKGLNTKASQVECFRRRPKNQNVIIVNPQPDNVAPPYVSPGPQPLPPSPAPSAARVPWLFLGILFLVGGVAGAIKHFRDIYSGK
jgi:hypothetical protein